jgi:heme exporter protein A
MTVIDAEDVRKSFGRSLVLRDVTVRVGAGEAVALFGPNGAGKSTLLRLCATLYEPTGGVLKLFGSGARDASVRGRIGLLSHQSFLYPDLSARENLVFYARMYGATSPEHTADEWLDRVGLADSAARPVRVFSRGMEQRLALARTLLHGPDLLLLDEPWSALDAAGADLLTALLRSLRGRGTTLVVATHDFERGLAVADRAIILHGGCIAWEGDDASDTGAVHAAYRHITGAVAA